MATLLMDAEACWYPQRLEITCLPYLLPQPWLFPGLSPAAGGWSSMTIGTAFYTALILFFLFMANGISWFKTPEKAVVQVTWDVPCERLFMWNCVHLGGAPKERVLLP